MVVDVVLGQKNVLFTQTALFEFVGLAALVSVHYALLDLAIDIEVGSAASNTPSSVFPVFDARGIFSVDEDIATDDELLPLIIVRATGAVRQNAFTTALEHEQRIVNCLQAPSPCWIAGWDLAGPTGAFFHLTLSLQNERCRGFSS